MVGNRLSKDGLDLKGERRWNMVATLHHHLQVQIVFRLPLLLQDLVEPPLLQDRSEQQKEMELFRKTKQLELR